MPCEVIADEIRRDIDVLVARQRDLPARHQSMRVVFGYSWQLLSDNERAAFCRLSVFRGGFTAEAAQKVAGASRQLLASLIDKSLLRLDDDGRYDLHELLRQYAQEKLELADETEDVFDSFCTYFLCFMQDCEANLKGPQQNEALDQIEATFDNVRAAWRRAVQLHSHALVDAAVDSLFLFCSLRSRLQDHQMLFGQARTAFAPEDRDEATTLWGRILARSYQFLNGIEIRNRTDVITDCETALRVAQSHGNQAETAFCLFLLARLTMAEDVAQALDLLKESAQRYLVIGEDFYRAYVVQAMAGCHIELEQFDEGLGKLRECIALCREKGFTSPMGLSLSVLGMIRGFRFGDFVEGEHDIREAVDLYRSMNSPGETVRILRWLSANVFVQGKVDEAQRLAEECRSIAIAHGLRDYQYLGEPMVSSAILGMVFTMQGEYGPAEVLGKEAVDRVTSAGGVGAVLANWSLACTYCGLGNFQAATDLLRLALLHAHGYVLQLGLTALCAPIAACVHTDIGNPERGVELLALAFTHPNSPTGWLEKWPLISKLRVDLEDELDVETYAAAWERGMALDLEQLNSQLLREFGAEVDDSATQANQALVEPLSERELEVLAHIADGLSNREIADRLYISISTVKKHVNHIYGKLDVKDRIEAIDYATTLGLIS